MIITVASVKGGAGKSTLIQALAVYLIDQGNSVEIVDVDPQQTTYNWQQDRIEFGLPQIPCTCMSGYVAKMLLEKSKFYDYVLVDTAGTDHTSMRSAISVCDLAVIPCRPKRRDLKAIKLISDVVNEIKAGGHKFVTKSVITQAPTLPSQGARIMKAKEVLSAYDLNPIKHITRNLNSWDDAEEGGGTVLEYEDNKSRDDALAVFEELLCP